MSKFDKYLMEKVNPPSSQTPSSKSTPKDNNALKLPIQDLSDLSDFENKISESHQKSESDVFETIISQGKMVKIIKQGKK